MTRILENKEHEVYCPHCGKRIDFTIEDVWSSYTRGLEDSESWLDPDCLWNYIHCPNCEKLISVDRKLDYNETIPLKEKYECDLEHNLCD